MSSVYRYRGAAPSKQKGGATRVTVTPQVPPTEPSLSEHRNREAAPGKEKGTETRVALSSQVLSPPESSSSEHRSRKHRKTSKTKSSERTDVANPPDAVNATRPLKTETEKGGVASSRSRREDSSHGGFRFDRDEQEKAQKQPRFDPPVRDKHQHASNLNIGRDNDARFEREEENPQRAQSCFGSEGGGGESPREPSSSKPQVDGDGDKASTTEAVLAALTKARDLASRPNVAGKTPGGSVAPAPAAASAAAAATDYMSAGWVAKENKDQPKRRRGAIPKSSASIAFVPAQAVATVSAPSEESLLTNDGSFLELAKRKIALGPPTTSKQPAAAPATDPLATPAVDPAYSGYYNGMSGYVTDTYLQQQQQQQQYYLQQQQQQAYLQQQQQLQEQYYAAQAAQATADPTAYHAAFWEYLAAYGEDLARQYYGEASPPPGTAPPPGVVDPTKIASETSTSEAPDGDVSGGVVEETTPVEAAALSEKVVDPLGGEDKTADTADQKSENAEEADQKSENAEGTDDGGVDGETNAIGLQPSDSVGTVVVDSTPLPSASEASDDTAAAVATAGVAATAGAALAASDGVVDAEAVLRQQWADYYAAQGQQQQQQQHAAYAGGYTGSGYAADPNTPVAYTDAYNSQYEAYFNHYKHAFSTQPTPDADTATAPDGSAPLTGNEDDGEPESQSLASELAAAYYSATTGSGV
eukprot:CAMPEP_0171713988 /NCGR_PEP_ID=MMETSP0991-20121206/18042_1 /TAXON_ID=483369 /ORGANISM="non described non described, Strain CCMP2098" /LENGTH=699 /DNA_ID=CAMNT_0012304673 /DNA_START=91 /DNA_END=2190 /DNA_ORIENTATION=-